MLENTAKAVAEHGKEFYVKYIGFIAPKNHIQHLKNHIQHLNYNTI